MKKFARLFFPFKMKISLNFISMIKLDFNTRRLFVKNRSLPLRNKEFTLLSYFFKNIGRVLSRTQLIEEVWDRNMCWATNTVDVHVSHLRRLLKKHCDRELIKTVHCIGYIFEI